MPSDSPPHPSNSGPDPEHPSAEPTEPASAPETATPPSPIPSELRAREGQRRQRGQNNPRITATLCYAVPYLVSLVVLLRERRNQFVRYHAAQAIVFFVTIPAIQLMLFVALIAVGNSVGTGKWAVALGVIFIAAFLALGIGAFLFWLRLLADCWAGQATVFPVIGMLAHRIEQLATQAHREVSSSRPLRQNTDIP